MMVPVGRLVLLRSVAKAEMVGAMAWLTVPALIGPVIGPPLGGFITTYFHWRWIFWINVPIGDPGHRAGHALHPGRARAAAPPLRLGRLRADRRSGLVGLMFGFETVGRGIVPGWARRRAAGGRASSASLLYVRHAGADRPSR